MRPFITPEEERIARSVREEKEPRADQLLFRLRKEKMESTVMAPTYAEDNIRHLAHNVSWERD